MKPRLSDRKSMGISNHSRCTPKLYIYAILAACRQTATSQPSKYKKNNKETTINNIYMAYQTLYLNCCLWLSLCCFMLFYVVRTYQQHSSFTLSTISICQKKMGIYNTNIMAKANKLPLARPLSSLRHAFTIYTAR